jgi:hypothetical protein
MRHAPPRPRAGRAGVRAAAVMLALLPVGAGPAAADLVYNRSFEVDHVWIVVSPGAPQREAFEQLGLIPAPGVNRHVGQGTASITFEFKNAFVELLWVDGSVPVAPGGEAAMRKFTRRQQWATSGGCPFGIALHRTPDAPDSLPFESWPLHQEWMPPGVSYRMLTPRADSLSPALWVVPRSSAVKDLDDPASAPVDSIRATALRQPGYLRTLTRVRLVCPAKYQPTDAMSRLGREGVFELRQERGWLLVLTFNGGVRRRTRDLRPELPVLVRY